MRNAVYEHGVRARFVHARAAEPGVLGFHAFISFSHLVDKGRRPRPFSANNNTYFEHNTSCFLINHAHRYKAVSFSATRASHVPSHPTRAEHFQSLFPTAHLRATGCSQCWNLRVRLP